MLNYQRVSHTYQKLAILLMHWCIFFLLSVICQLWWVKCCGPSDGEIPVKSPVQCTLLESSTYIHPQFCIHIWYIYIYITYIYMMCIYILYISCIYRMYGCISTPVYLLQYCTISSYPSIGDWSQASDLQSASSQFLVRQKEPQRPGQLGGFDDHGDTLWLFNIAMENPW